MRLRTLKIPTVLYFIIDPQTIAKHILSELRETLYKTLGNLVAYPELAIILPPEEYK